MVSIRVTHSIGDLSADLTEIAVQTRPRMRSVVRDGIKVGKTLARQYSRDKSGPHGKALWKRINSEMTGPLEGEFGYDGTPKSDFVGGGFRHGINTDLPRAADIVGPSFLRSVDDEVGDMFKAHGF